MLDADNPISIFPPGYFERMREAVIRGIEGERWSLYVESERRYLLCSTTMIIQDDLNQTCGTVTARLDLRVYSDTVKELKRFWRQFAAVHSDTTTQHIIVDTKERKVVEFLQGCL